MNNKILYIGGFELPDKNAAAHRVIGISNIFKLLNYEIILVGVTKEKAANTYSKIDQSYVYYEVNYPNNALSWFRYLWGCDRIFKYIEQEDPSIVILYNYPSMAMARILKFCRKRDIKIIADTTEWYEGTGNLLKRNIKKIDVFYRMKFLNKDCDAHIVISNYLFRYYKNQQKSLAEIPPVFDIENKKYYNDLNVYNINDDCINLIYSGSPGAGNKDRLDFVVQSVAKFIKIKLKVVGVTYEQYSQIFEDTNIYKNVEFVGRIEHSKALQLIKESDFTIFLREENLPNLAGFPTKFAESISVGTPVLTNASSNLNDFFKFNIGFEIEEVSVSAIDEILRKVIILDKNNIKSMKKNCLDLRLFDYRNYMDSVRHLLNN